MIKSIYVDKLAIKLIRKPVKNVHLSVHPPNGNVKIVTPLNIKTDVARAYVISKLAWIKKQQSSFKNQVRSKKLRFENNETHFLWGEKHLLKLKFKNVKPHILLKNKTIQLTISKNSTKAQRKKAINEWYKFLLHKAVLKLLDKWEKKIKVKVNGYFLQRMKTKWGSANFKEQNIRINTELVKKPKKLLEYIIAHEMIHLIEPTHNLNFRDLLQRHYPKWNNARNKLNKLPLAAEIW